VADLPTIEGFRLLHELGAGNLSTVYAAVEEPLGRMVALKVLRATIETTSTFAQQLEREARTLAELCHPNVGLLHAFYKTEARMFMVLEYVDGSSLATVLKKKPGVPVDSVAAIGASVARGLAHAHERGIVHRDVKPANIMISRRGEVKIFDFGIAQHIRGATEVALPLARVEDVSSFGTPAYMSPEQILGESVDARSDVFSLGVVLYQLVCGARPFERGDEAEGRPAAHRIRRDPPIPLHRRAPGVPPAFERIVMRAIEKLPADRFQTADALADELSELGLGRSGLRSERLVMRALEHAGLVTPVEVEVAAAPVERKQRGSSRQAMAGLATIGALVVGGGGALQATAKRQGDSGELQMLELAPVSPGYLRVLAMPWAEVWIDGQRVDVTPFARAIPLAPGTHYVTLVHPNAPKEKRTLNLGAGETRTIDVVMAVADAPAAPAPSPSASARLQDSAGRSVTAPRTQETKDDERRALPGAERERRR
jgi:serine/threonine-protein kinase